MSKVKVIEVQDKYNSAKTWLVKRYSKGEYYLSQAINGKRLYPFTRRSLSNIKEIGISI